MSESFTDAFHFLDAIPDHWLRDGAFLENELIPFLGLNDEGAEEQPACLSHCRGAGFGWRIWQYPNQFAAYLLHLGRHASQIETYLEIGSRHGGSFVLTAWYLSRLNPKFRHAAAVDLIAEPALITHAKTRLPLSYHQADSASPAFRDWLAPQHFDLALIDGDHSFRGVLNDFDLLKEKTKFLAFHDIANIACPDVVNFWYMLKRFWFRPDHGIKEFTTQYQDTPSPGPFLGIGWAATNPEPARKSPHASGKRNGFSHAPPANEVGHA